MWKEEVQQNIHIEKSLYNNVNTKGVELVRTSSK